ncbi:hypothetical protein HQN60_14425 [Deefgea piscis]|uniref:Uncharacterized protein n=1 Tax=Deefgea piscis TaxID=2739061 RepID=A0A6M8SX42_9NEIS|nr:hypothetical protein [Deefgea piscis]QKJ67820.1 hypothetical protein HQN60_14425 [Deefgea piscis]
MSMVQQLPHYICGHHHPLEAYQQADDHSQTLCWSAMTLPCPNCCTQIVQTLDLNPQVYVNLQQLSSSLTAFVIEVSEVSQPLDGVLSLTGYVQRAASIDELHPGGDIFDLPNAVWRKEYWFDNDTEPMHVVALLRHLKQEMRWLETYLPQGMRAIHFADFVGTA